MEGGNQPCRSDYYYIIFCARTTTKMSEVTGLPLNRFLLFQNKGKLLLQGVYRLNTQDEKRMAEGKRNTLFLFYGWGNEAL